MQVGAGFAKRESSVAQAAAIGAGTLMKCDLRNHPTLLALCLPIARSGFLDTWAATQTHMGSEALTMLQMHTFDLFLCGEKVSDMPLRFLIRRFRHQNPAQRWVLIGSTISDADEIFARIEGAVAVLDAMPEMQCLLRLANLRPSRWGTPAAFHELRRSAERPDADHDGPLREVSVQPLQSAVADLRD